MDCIEARLLIERGVTPGARNSAATRLGFHLASCAECRAYRENHSALLNTLLLDSVHPNVQPALPAKAGPVRPIVLTPVAPPSLVPPATPRLPATRRSAPARGRGWGLRFGAIVLIAIPLGLLLWLGAI